MTDPLDLRDLAAVVTTDIAAFLLEEVGQAHEPDLKSSATDLVTAIDRAAEARIVSAISEARPDDGLMGEEGTDTPSRSGVRWIIDPIDGTTNFVFSHPGFGVSIAAEQGGTVVAGAVADPVHGQLFDAALHHGARCNGRPLQARPTTDLARALVATGFGYSPSRRRAQAEALAEILPEIADIRRMGSAALDLCGVALGRVDAYYEQGLNTWDFAAGALIAAEAGAHVVVPAPDAESTLIVAAAPGIADELMALLQRVGLTE